MNTPTPLDAIPLPPLPEPAYLGHDSDDGAIYGYDSAHMNARYLAGYASGLAAQAAASPANASTAPQAAARHYPLPDNLYAGSKDWLAGDYAERVEWLHSMYEARKADVERMETAAIPADVAKKLKALAKRLNESAFSAGRADMDDSASTAHENSLRMARQTCMQKMLDAINASTTPQPTVSADVAKLVEEAKQSLSEAMSAAESSGHPLNHSASKDAAEARDDLLAIIDRLASTTHQPIVAADVAKFDPDKYEQPYLPEHIDCAMKRDREEELSALDEFILDNEPAGVTDEYSWRIQLNAVIEAERLKSATTPAAACADLGPAYIPDDQGPEDVRYVREDRALAAISTASVGVVPDNMVMVPRHPTARMIEAIQFSRGQSRNSADVWYAALAERPAAAAQPASNEPHHLWSHPRHSPRIARPREATFAHGEPEWVREYPVEVYGPAQGSASDEGADHV